MRSSCCSESAQIQERTRWCSDRTRHWEKNRVDWCELIFTCAIHRVVRCAQSCRPPGLRRSCFQWSRSLERSCGINSGCERLPMITRGWRVDWLETSRSCVFPADRVASGELREKLLTAENAEK